MAKEMHYTHNVLFGFKTIEAFCGKRVAVNRTGGKVTCPHCLTNLRRVIGENAELSADIPTMNCSAEWKAKALALVQKQTEEFNAVLEWSAR